MIFYEENDNEIQLPKVIQQMNEKQRQQLDKILAVYESIISKIATFYITKIKK